MKNKKGKGTKKGKLKTKANLMLLLSSRRLGGKNKKR